MLGIMRKETEKKHYTIVKKYASCTPWIPRIPFSPNPKEDTKEQQKVKQKVSNVFHKNNYVA